MPAQNKKAFRVVSQKQHPVNMPSMRVDIATITGIDAEGYPLVNCPERQHESSLTALTQVNISQEDVGKSCTIAYIGGDLTRPVVMGLLQTPVAPSREIQLPQKQDQFPDDVDIEEVLDIDSQEAVVIRSDQSIVLQTGKSRIELYPNGYINLQGVHINSQAYGPNRIKGGSVKLN